MPLPAFFPNVKYVPHISDTGDSLTIEQLCERSKTPCMAYGNWTQRRVFIKESNTESVCSEPGDWSFVEIRTPKGLSETEQARWALGALAYVLFDGVARASVKGQKWARIALPRGAKPGSVKPMTNAERQRKHRQTK